MYIHRFFVTVVLTKTCSLSSPSGTIEPTSEATPIQVSTTEYGSITSQSSTIVTSSPGLTTYVTEEVVIDDPVIVTASEEVGSSAVESEESVEVLVQDDDTPTEDDIIQIPTTQEIVQEVGGVSGRGKWAG